MSASFSTALLSRIEDAGINASAPPQQRLVDGWLLRFSPGAAKRGRCVNAVAAGVLPLADKLDHCEAVFAQAGLRPTVRITPFSKPAELDATLDARDYTRCDDTQVLLRCDLAPCELPPAPGLSLERIGAARFAHVVGGLRQASLALRAAHAERLVNAPVPFSAWLLRRDGEIVACGQFALENDLAGLYDIYTAPPARGRGLARRLCQEMLNHACAQGARHAYLQVEAHNAPALAVYRRLGFAHGYDYHYRIRG